MIDGTQAGQGWIYAVHRDDGSIAYVGQTVELPAVRFRQHIRDALTGSLTLFHGWLRERAEAGDCPRVSTIERCSLSLIDERERFWIQFHHAEQADGVLNIVHIQERAAQRVADAQRKAHETRRRNEDHMVDVLKQFLAGLGDGPHRLSRLRDDAKKELLKAGIQRDTVRDLLLFAARSAGFVERPPSHVVRVGSNSDGLTDPGRTALERVAGALDALVAAGARVSARKVADATLLPATECRLAMESIGWAFSEYGARWSPPEDRQTAHTLARLDVSAEQMEARRA